MGIKHLSLNCFFNFHSFFIVFCPKRRQNVLSKIWMDFHSQWILIIRIHFSSLKGYIILHHLCFSYHLEIRFLLLSLFYPWVLPFCPPSCSSGIWRSWLHFPFYPFELWSPVQPICLETFSFFWFWDSISSSFNLFFFVTILKFLLIHWVCL